MCWDSSHNWSTAVKSYRPGFGYGFGYGDRGGALLDMIFTNRKDLLRNVNV